MSDEDMQDGASGLFDELDGPSAKRGGQKTVMCGTYGCTLPNNHRGGQRNHPQKKRERRSKKSWMG